MRKYLIVLADHPCGRGSRGLNLARFLATFHGTAAVDTLTTDELTTARPLAVDTLFIGMPTRLEPRHLTKIRYRQAVLFDYLDGPNPAWLDSNREWLCSLTDRYLRPWVEPTWNFGLRMGVLPIRRHAKLTFCLRGQAVLDRLSGRSGTRCDHDVVFLGAATTGGADDNQRVRWLREIKAYGDRYAFWGGLVVRPWEWEELSGLFPDLDHLAFSGGRVDFWRYFRHLHHARVALAPAGNARWTYRHYETIYAGALPVSTDFRRVRTLIPLPPHGMVHVADGDPVLPAIDRALALRRDCPDLPAENIRFLETYLRHGDYCRRKPALMDAFLAQLSG